MIRYERPNPPIQTNSFVPYNDVFRHPVPELRSVHRTDNRPWALFGSKEMNILAFESNYDRFSPHPIVRMSVAVRGFPPAKMRTPELAFGVPICLWAKAKPLKADHFHCPLLSGRLRLVTFARGCLFEEELSRTKAYLFYIYGHMIRPHRSTAGILPDQKPSDTEPGKAASTCAGSAIRLWS